MKVRGLTDNDTMSFKAEDNDIENNNINNNNSTPKFTTQSVPPSSYDSDREIMDKDIKEETEQQQREREQQREEERERQRSRRSASDRSNRESSTTPVDQQQQSSSASLSSYPSNPKKPRLSVCDTPNLPFGNTQERQRSDSGLVCLRFVRKLIFVSSFLTSLR